eukprot:scaffold83440_cov42-Phaeocystis_antarctica.AAC.1
MGEDARVGQRDGCTPKGHEFVTRIRVGNNLWVEFDPRGENVKNIGRTSATLADAPHPQASPPRQPQQLSPPAWLRLRPSPSPTSAGRGTQAAPWS